MAWATTAAAITNLRSLIKDNPTDKICYQKEVIGMVDGTNPYFKTFEYRRLTNFTTNAGSTFPLGVWKNNTLLTSVQVTADDTASGAFTLANAVIPSATSRDVIRATYYYQWFTDSELDAFLQNASAWLGLGNTYINIPDGLNVAALRFSAQEAYEAAAMKYSTRMAEVYKLSDAPSEAILKSIQAFREMANDFMSKAETLRDDYYTRQGQALAPNFSFALGQVTDPTPRR
jgi:hypothetical protein